MLIQLSSAQTEMSLQLDVMRVQGGDSDSPVVVTLFMPPVLARS